MSSRRWAMVAAALVLVTGPGCGLLCDRYCDRMHDRCDRYYSRGCAAPAAVACPPGCAPTANYYGAAPAPHASYCP